MSAQNDVFRLALGAVVLDRPDLGGVYIAKDLVGGWAYHIADGAGDARFRGHGACEGGLDMALRRGFLAALGRVPGWREMLVLVDSAPAHQALAALARTDAHVIAAIAGRPVTIMTRPDARVVFSTRAAAERAAAAALLERERAERAVLAAADAFAPPAPPPADPPVLDRAAPAQRPGQTPDPAIAGLADMFAAAVARETGARETGARERLGTPAITPPVSRVDRPAAPRRGLADWRVAFDGRVKRVAADLRDLAG
jgi:hypothetical protein